MHLNRDELLLLSRGGRLPLSQRAGPGRLRGRPPVDRGAAPVTVAGGGLHRLAARLRRRGSSHALPGYADREAYVRLEFAVGFTAEDEPWR